MPEYLNRRIRVTLEFRVNGSLSDGTAIDTAVGEILKIREVQVRNPHDQREVALYVKPPEITSITIEKR